MTPLTADAFNLNNVGANVRLRPSITVFPDRLNRVAYPYWVRAIKHPETAKRIQTARTPQEAWVAALRRLMVECDQAKVVPFITATGQTNNAQLEWRLRRERVELVRFYTRANFFAKFPRPTSTTVRYDFASNGFTLTRTLRTQAPRDPTFKEWLVSIPYPKFLRDPDRPGLYTKVLTSFTTLHVEYTNQLRVDISYSIRSTLLPVIDGRRQLPRKPELIDYIEANIWTPIVQANRIPGLSLRQY